MNPDVVVIGAGFAGLSAAVRLTSAGLRVLVLEEKPRLGGRAATFVDRGTGERVDNGQHVLFGCYRETYRFLEQIGTASLAPLQPRLSLLMAARERAYRFECPGVRPPWHLVLGVLRWNALPLSDRLAVLRLRHLLREVRRQGAAEVAARVPPEMTVSQWLHHEGQGEALCRWLWRPLAVAALNQSPDVAAAAPFVRVVGELFGPRVEDSAVGLPAVPLDDLYAEPARRFVEGRGGRVIKGERARLSPAEGGWLVNFGGHSVSVSAVVSAVAWHDIERLWATNVPEALAGTVTRAGLMASCPIVTVNFWFDGPIADAPFVGLVDGSMHWAFDKTALYRDAAVGHVAVVASGADAIAGLDNDDLTRRAVADLGAALPTVRSRRLLRSVVVRERRATFSVAPGSPARPSITTPLDGFFIAGDWADTGLPGTIESAVTSGHRAAELASQYIRGRSRRAR